MIQICRNQCDVLKLYIADDGLYCVDEFVSLSLPLSPAIFAAESKKWSQKLFSLRKYVLNSDHLLNDTDQKSYDQHFSRPANEESRKIDYRAWTRGSFYSPINEESPLYLPENSYGNSPENSKKQCIMH